uniref:Putative HSP transcription factor n=1 Tax=Davidia involucrata TaxID=16924 RepID=A0A5B7C0N4_DAVIN
MDVMAPLPVEQIGKPGGRDSQRSLPTPFLTKTYQLVDNSSIDDLISWNEDGTTFIIWRPAEFARDLLPKYFKHNNFSSFVRQLNTYGFRKVVPDRWEFANECFRRGEKVLLQDIQCRKVSPSATTATGTAGAVASANAQTVTVAVPPAAQAVSPAISGGEQVLSSNSSPAAITTASVHRGTTCTSTPEIQEENELLRKENMQLTRELNRLRSLCNNICTLMTNYNTDQQETSGVPEGRALDLLPAEDDGAAPRCGRVMAEKVMSPRLFGVSIGVKRVRRRGGEQHGAEVKSEPLDEGTDHEKDPPLCDKL